MSAWSKAQERKLRELYPQHGQRYCAELLGKTENAIRVRANRLGLHRWSQQRWLPSEVALLHETSGLSAKRASQLFQRAGFERTGEAIACKRQVLGLRYADDRPVSGEMAAVDVAELLGIHPSIVQGWIKRGWLKHRQYGNREFSIKETWLRQFFIKHPSAVNLHSIPPASSVWFVTLLLGIELGEA